MRLKDSVHRAKCKCLSVRRGHANLVEFAGERPNGTILTELLRSLITGVSFRNSGLVERAFRNTRIPKQPFASMPY
jgi:hypothetical protein